MGYTHYFRTAKRIPMAKWNELTKAVNKILEGQDILNFECDDNRPPIVNHKEIRFNGIGEDGHETFLLMKNNSHPDWGDKSEPMVFNFCKTARKPYDVYVTAILFIASQILGDHISISSDGYVSEWQEGIALANRKLGTNYIVKDNPTAEYPDDISTAIIENKLSLSKAIDGLNDLPELKELPEQA